MSAPRLQTPLARARGLGSAREGTGHFWWQRVTAIVLVPLSLWLVWSLLTHVVGGTRVDVAMWIARPQVAVLLLIFCMATFYHAKLGVQVIIEDYVHTESNKIALLIFNSLGFAFLAVMTLFALVKLHFFGI